MELRQHPTVSEEKLFLGEGLSNSKLFKNRELNADFSCFRKQHIPDIWVLPDRFTAA